jgi:hypothetical protein
VLPETEEEEKKRRLWEFDPTMFESGRRAGFFERYFTWWLRKIGKYSLYAIAFLWPVLIVAIGVAFGGLAFWVSFLASFAIIGFVIRRLGFEANFANWNVSNTKFAGLIFAFAVAMGFYLGIIYLKIWLLPIAVGVLGVTFVLGILRKNRT